MCKRVAELPLNVAMMPLLFRCSAAVMPLLFFTAFRVNDREEPQYFQRVEPSHGRTGACDSEKTA